MQNSAWRMLGVWFKQARVITVPARASALLGLLQMDV